MRDTEERAQRQVRAFSLAAMALLLILLVLGGLFAAHLIHPTYLACDPSWYHC
jgi:hypothetical protein